MKVGKKALSLLLAVIMIMSSISVSFGVLAADTSIDYAYSIISTYFDELVVAIDASNRALEKVEEGNGRKLVQDVIDRGFHILREILRICTGICSKAVIV